MLHPFNNGDATIIRIPPVNATQNVPSQVVRWSLSMDAESLEMLRQISERDTRSLSAEVRHLVRERHNQLFGAGNRPDTNDGSVQAAE